jgi:hypothetical protein
MPSEIATTFAQIISNGLKRKSLVTCSKWAEKCRIMGKPFPGPYSFKHYPWAREMHDAKSEKWVGQKGAQLGFTEVALNRTFFTIDILRIDCLYLLPTQTPDASNFSAGRFNPALQLSPYLRDLFSDVQNVGHKRAGSTNLYVRGTRSRSQLKSIPAGLIVFDEVDEMAQKNLPLAEHRQSGQLERQQIWISTPTVPGRGINLLYEESTKEHFCFKCPSCSRFIELIFPDNLLIEADSLHDPNINNSRLVCKQCDAVLPHQLKCDWLSSGIWIPEDADAPWRGFNIPQLYSPTQTPVIIAENYFKAKQDPSEEQEFYNSNLGQVHEVKGARVSDSDILECINNFALKSTIQAGTLVTMGVDQGGEIHYEVDAWYPLPFTNSSVDLNLRFRPKLIDAGKVMFFEDLDRLMRRWQVRACVIDANPEKRKALEFASRFDGYVFLCIYVEGVSGKNLNKWSNEPTISVDRTAWLDLSLGRFHNHNIAIPANIGDEYKSHIKAPIRMPKVDKNGNHTARYVTGDHVADHFAHARNYSEIALSFAADIATTQIIRSPR